MQPASQLPVLPWLLGIAHNVLRESARRDRIETRARKRLRLPLEVAEEDGYAAVDERLSPRAALAAALDEIPDHERDALDSSGRGGGRLGDRRGRCSVASRRRVAARRPVAVDIASAAERASAVLDPPPGRVVHDVVAYRQTAPGGSVSSWREETWRATSAPYARRTLTMADGRAVIRFSYANPSPGGELVRWSYVVDARSYAPLRITTTSPDGSSTTARFGTYETLAADADAKRLLSVRRRHPGATVDASKADYQAAQARMQAPRP